MDHRRFDHLSRRLAGRLTRRGAIARAAVALASGGAATTIVASDAGAARAVCRAAGMGCTRNAQCCSTICATGRDVPRARRNRCVCPEDTLTCGSVCCPAGSACIAGACVSSCTRAEGAAACLLSARSIVQLALCDLAVVADDDRSCIDDSDCSLTDFHPDVRLDHVGCMVAYTDIGGEHADLAGACMTWRTGVDFC